MKITLEHYEFTCFIETKADDLDATEVLKNLTKLMLCAGWEQGSIDNAIMALNEEIEL